MMIEKKAKGKGKAIIGIAMAVIMLASVLAVMVPMSEARTTANEIDAGDTVYIGEQGLALDMNGDGFYGDVGILVGVEGTPTEIEAFSVSAIWTVPPVTEGKYYYDANANGMIDPGEFYIFIDHAEITGDIILNTVTQDSIVGLSVPTSAEIVFKAELNYGGGKIPGAEFKIVFTDPDGVVFNTIDGQALRHLDATLGTTLYVTGLPAPWGVTTVAPPAGGYPDAIDLTDMGTGTYKVKIKTEKTACNMLDVSSPEYEFTIRKYEFSIEAEKTSVAELEKIKLIVAGAPGHAIRIDSSDWRNTLFPGGLEDNPPADTTAIFTDTIDFDGKRTYIVKFTDTGSYTIIVTDTTTGYTDTEDITVTEKGRVLVSIATDKALYSLGEIMQTVIRLQNPTDNTKNVLFTWYLGIPEYDLWSEMTVMPVNLYAGYDQTVTVPIPVGNWGTESFCGFHIVSLTDTTTEKVVSVDSTAWIYKPSAMSESKTAEEIAKEIKKEIEGVELPS